MIFVFNETYFLIVEDFIVFGNRDRTILNIFQIEILRIVNLCLKLFRLL